MDSFDNFVMERIEEIILDLKTDAIIAENEREIINYLPPELKKKYIDNEDMKDKQIRENYIKLLKSNPNI